MSRNCCNTESSCCNNNCCNTCNGYGNGGFGFAGSWFYILAIFLLFGGGGSGPGSFWGGYGNAFSCSGFNNGSCNNIGYNNFTNGNLTSGNYNNSSFSGNTLSNSNISNTNLADFLTGLSNNSNFDIGNIAEPYN